MSVLYIYKRAVVGQRRWAHGSSSSRSLFPRVVDNVSILMYSMFQRPQLVITPSNYTRHPHVARVRKSICLQVADTVSRGIAFSLVLSPSLYIYCPESSLQLTEKQPATCPAIAYLYSLIHITLSHYRPPPFASYRPRCAT